MLVGVSAGRIEKLCDLDISEEEYFGSDENTDKPPPMSFANVLSGFMFKNKPKNKLTEMKSAGDFRLQAEGEEITVEPDIDETSTEEE
jgi:hypothetical protein